MTSFGGEARKSRGRHRAGGALDLGGVTSAADTSRLEEEHPLLAKPWRGRALYAMRFWLMVGAAGVPIVLAFWHTDPGATLFAVGSMVVIAGTATVWMLVAPRSFVHTAMRGTLVSDEDAAKPTMGP